MNRIDADQGDIADSVTHTRVADLGPESLIARGIGSIKADMAEARDAGVASRKITHAAVIGPRHDLDLVAGGIARRDEGPHAPRVAFRPRAEMDGAPRLFELGADAVEIGCRPGPWMIRTWRCLRK